MIEHILDVMLHAEEQRNAKNLKYTRIVTDSLENVVRIIYNEFLDLVESISVNISAYLLIFWHLS